MDINIPTVAEVQEALRPLSLRQLGRLAELSGVPMPTIYKIRIGETKSPGVDTVRKFLPHIRVAAEL